ncbi:hypothetical protein DFJ73DRAFT_885601 [Zopfochytrium polystomum]|nr:hypothetical protein DFJ73DRAFT_885601 [Zopfochytrium polystomum]
MEEGPSGTCLKTSMGIEGLGGLGEGRPAAHKGVQQAASGAAGVLFLSFDGAQPSTLQSGAPANHGGHHPPIHIKGPFQSSPAPQIRKGLAARPDEAVAPDRSDLAQLSFTVSPAVARKAGVSKPQAPFQRAMSEIQPDSEIRATEGPREDSNPGPEFSRQSSLGRLRSREHSTSSLERGNGPMIGRSSDRMVMHENIIQKESSAVSFGSAGFVQEAQKPTARSGVVTPARLIKERSLSATSMRAPKDGQQNQSAGLPKVVQPTNSTLSIEPAFSSKTQIRSTFLPSASDALPANVVATNSRNQTTSISNESSSQNLLDSALAPKASSNTGVRDRRPSNKQPQYVVEKHSNDPSLEEGAQSLKIVNEGVDGQTSSPHSRTSSNSGRVANDSTAGRVWKPGGTKNATRDEFVRNKMKAKVLAERLRQELLGPETGSILKTIGKHDRLAPIRSANAHTKQMLRTWMSQSSPTVTIISGEQLSETDSLLPSAPALPVVRSVVSYPVHPRGRKIKLASTGRPPLPLDDVQSEQRAESSGRGPLERTRLPSIPSSANHWQKVRLEQALSGPIWLDNPIEEVLREHELKTIFVNDIMMTEKIATEKAVNASCSNSRSVNFVPPHLVKDLDNEQAVLMCWNIFRYLRCTKTSIFPRDVTRQILDLFENPEGDEEEQIFEIKRIFAKLPKECFVVMKALFFHLARIGQIIPIRSLAALFAPLVFRTPSRRQVTFAEPKMKTEELDQGKTSHISHLQRQSPTVGGEGFSFLVNGELAVAESTSDASVGGQLSRAHQNVIGASLDHLTIAGESYTSRQTGLSVEIDKLWETLTEIMEEEEAKPGARPPATASSANLSSNNQSRESQRKKVPGFRDDVGYVTKAPLVQPFATFQSPATSPLVDQAGLEANARGDPPSLVVEPISVESEDANGKSEEMPILGLDDRKQGLARSQTILSTVAEPESEEGVEDPMTPNIGSESEYSESENGPAVDPMEQIVSLMEGPAMSMNVITPRESIALIVSQKLPVPETERETSQAAPAPKVINFGDNDPEGFGWNLLTEQSLAVKIFFEEICLPASAAALETVLLHLEVVSSWNTFSSMQAASSNRSAAILAENSS